MTSSKRAKQKRLEELRRQLRKAYATATDEEELLKQAILAGQELQRLSQLLWEATHGSSNDSDCDVSDGGVRVHADVHADDSSDTDGSSSESVPLADATG